MRRGEGMRKRERFMVGLLFCGLLTFGCEAKGGVSERETEPMPSAELPSAPLGQRGNWTLVFHDEFEGTTLDTDKWVTCYWWDYEGCTNEGNENLGWYLPENVLVEDGKLILRAKEESVTTPDGTRYDYTSGMVTTGRDTSDLSVDPKATFKHVYVEMRARVPQGRGLWPAFWMLPAIQESKPEIDVMEMLGDNPYEVHMNFHYLDERGDENRAGYTWVSPEPITGWHVFAHDWQPRALTWYVDGVKHSHVNEYVPDEPMYLIANLAVGGEWPGDPDEDTVFPSDLEIDYIRVWMRD
jgi:beta-glucanase (GH16 family)